MAAAAGLVLLPLAVWSALPWLVAPPAGALWPDRSLELLARDGRPLRDQPVGSVVAKPLAYEEIPAVFRQALLAAEDERFFEHPGVDPVAILRAASKRVRTGSSGGASGITQQLVKLTEPQPRTLGGKIREALQALSLERQATKEEIFAAYVNRLDFGWLNRGLAAASDFYLAKPAVDLTPAEAAFLAAIPHAPGRLNPLRNVDGTRARQHWILHRMRDAGFLTGEALRRAVREPIRLADAGRNFHAPHFVDHLLGQLPAGTSGPVVTTIDLPLQRAVEEVVQRQVRSLRSSGMTHAAVVVIENRTGAVRALAGSFDYFDRESGMVNGATAVRPAGSALKPFAYVAALENGRTLADILPDVPMRFETPDGAYEPTNYEKRFRGPVRIRAALASSLNVPAVALVEALTPTVFHRQLEAFGLKTLSDGPERYGLGIVLGNAEVRLLELTNAYAALARMGVHLPVQCLEEAGAGAPRRVARADATWLIADCLRDAAARAPGFGYRTPLRLPFPAAVKTGTSTDYRDNWCLGFTPGFTVGVWAGDFKAREMAGVSGVTGAGPIWKDVMLLLHAGRENDWYPRPSGISTAWVHPLTGKRLPDGWVDAVEEKFLPGTVPDFMQPEDYDPAGRVLLPDRFSSWLQGEGCWMTPEATTRRLLGETAPRILFPKPGAIFALDADLPEGGSQLRLEAEPGGVEWASPTLPITRRDGRPYATMIPGVHRIECRSDEGTASVEIRVERL